MAAVLRITQHSWHWRPLDVKLNQGEWKYLLFFEIYWTSTFAFFSFHRLSSEWMEHHYQLISPYQLHNYNDSTSSVTPKPKLQCRRHNLLPQLYFHFPRARQGGEQNMYLLGSEQWEGKVGLDAISPNPNGFFWGTGSDGLSLNSRAWLFSSVSSAAVNHYLVTMYWHGVCRCQRMM